jgi:multidrug efflux pump subunit AcrA (membrane-fusion protein)
MEFRRRALARLGRAEESDVPVVLAGTRSVLLLALATVLVAGGAVWACAGSLPQTVHAAGVLTRAAGSTTLRSPVAGQIVDAPVPEGADFTPGTVLFTVAGADGPNVVRAVSAGRMASVLAVVGGQVTVRDTLAVIEPGPAGSPLEAALYLPPADAARVRPGQHVDLAVLSVPDQKYGVVLGTVQEVGARPQTRGELAAFLADPDLAGDFVARGEPVRVIVRLLPGNTVSGYRWSTPQGPPYPIDTRTLVSAAIDLPPVRPVSLVVS